MNKRNLVGAACVLSAAALVVGLYRSAHRADASAGTVAVVDTRVAEWSDNPEQALTSARAENKDVLIEFDGPSSAETNASHPAVLDSREFCSRAGRQFVLVRLASTADASPERATLVSTWGQRLGIDAFPSIVLLDSQGRPCASSACDCQDLETAFALIDRLGHVKTRRDEFIAAADHVSGIERARHLDEALQQVGAFAGEAYCDVMRQITLLDASDAAGLRSKYENKVAEIDINRAIQSEVYPQIDKGNLTGAMQRLDRLIAETSASQEQRQLLMAFKGQLYFSLHDLGNAARTFDEAIRIAPQSEAAAKVVAARAQIFGPAS